MQISEQVETILLGALESLRALIEEGVMAQRFEEVGRIAGVAAAVKSILEVESSLRRHEQTNGVNNRQSTVSSENSPVAEAENAVRASSSQEIPRRGVSRPPKYPTFEREQDRLVKIGWSKKDASVYEHKAAQAAVEATARAILRVGKGKSVFSMDDVLPVRADKLGDVPSYQAYVVLAWLREAGLVKKVGKSGYSLGRKNLDEPAIKQAWLSTPSRDD